MQNNYNYNKMTYTDHVITPYSLIFFLYLSAVFNFYGIRSSVNTH